jgi:hypothetical protein
MEIRVLTASLKEQASQIQKVSAQVQMSKPALQMSSTISKSCHDLAALAAASAGVN